MKRLVIVACVVPFALTAIALAQPLAGPADSGRAAPRCPPVAAPAWNDAGTALPAPAAPQAAPVPSVPYTITPQAAPAPISPFYPPPYRAPAQARPARPRCRRKRGPTKCALMQSQAQEESIRPRGGARAEQRTRRLESQRWFGISNKRPNASVDPFDGDYAAVLGLELPLLSAPLGRQRTAVGLCGSAVAHFFGGCRPRHVQARRPACRRADNTCTPARGPGPCLAACGRSLGPA